MVIQENLVGELEKMLKHYMYLQEAMADPEESKKPTFNEILKEFGSLQKIMRVYEQFKEAQQNLTDNQGMLEEADIEDELRQMAEEEIEQYTQESEELFQQIKQAIYTEEASADRVIVEIRAGTGGDEAALFAADLFRMYCGYFERYKYKFEVLDSTQTELKGFKNIVFAVKGKDIYSHLQYESGGHRVQRIPSTESGGRIHTSAATVAVLPEVQEIEIQINPSDLIVETFRSSGPGGQSVNTMDSAVRITHKPSGTVVSCQDGKSQRSNKEQAMRILRSRIYEEIKAKRDKERGDMRRSQIGSGDRSQRIRTYNFPQNRVTDHRINVSLYNLDLFMIGEIDDMLQQLNDYYREQYFEEYVSVYQD